MSPIVIDVKELHVSTAEVSYSNSYIDYLCFIKRVHFNCERLEKEGTVCVGFINSTVFRNYNP